MSEPPTNPDTLMQKLSIKGSTSKESDDMTQPCGIPDGHDKSDKVPKIRIKNRRKRYIDTHPLYFSANLESADPLLYDRLVRRFQTAAEREAEGRSKGFSGIMEADIARSEARIHAIRHPDPNSIFGYQRGKNGEILEEDRDDVPTTKEEGLARWKWEMEMRFLRGDDIDFDYKAVDENENYDDRPAEDREALENYLDQEDPAFILEEGTSPQGETGVQDF